VTLTRTAAALTLTASCLLPAACASSHHGAASTPPPSTSTIAQPAAKASFISHASAACHASNRQLRHAAGHAFGRHRPAPATWRAFMISTALPIISHRLNTIAALPKPDTDHATIAAILNAGKAALTAATDNPHLISPATPAPFGTYDRLTTAYGIPACAVGG
jgi:hypothetical protein